MGRLEDWKIQFVRYFRSVQNARHLNKGIPEQSQNLAQIIHLDVIKSRTNFHLIMKSTSSDNRIQAFLSSHSCAQTPFRVSLTQGNVPYSIENQLFLIGPPEESSHHIKLTAYWADYSNKTVDTV